MLKWIIKFLDRISAVIGALFFMQFPLFIAQYIQQLNGRESELHRQVISMTQAASLSGKSLDQYIYKFLQSTDSDFVLQGGIIQSMITRWQSTLDALLSLRDSTVFSRPWIFLTHLDGEVFQSTFQNYTFGMPFSIEGGTYAFFGIVAGYLLFSGLILIFHFCSRVVLSIRKKYKTS